MKDKVRTPEQTRPDIGRRKLFTASSLSLGPLVLRDGLSENAYAAQESLVRAKSIENLLDKQHPRKRRPLWRRNAPPNQENGHSPTPEEPTSNGHHATKAPKQREILKVKDICRDKTSVDTLHNGLVDTMDCKPGRCLGSVMFPPFRREPGSIRERSELIAQATDFFEQFYTDSKQANSDAHQKRLQEVLSSIESRGTYDLTFDELTFGAKTAWRNASRCIGRIQWSKLKVFDFRRVTTAREMFEALCTHIEYGTNRGNIRSAISVFPPRTDGRHDFRVWNTQLISYAGYRQPDGSVIGDPAGVAFTEVCQQMGWKSNGGRFDVLPLVLSANGEDPEFFDIPPELVVQVKLRHPKYEWFAELGLQWFALPAVSGMMFDCGGLEFTAAPFNGWYMGTEVGARDLCDAQRYNILQTVGEKMGLDVTNVSSLWKDRALVEVNIAVLYSYQQDKVTIADHHVSTESFMQHFENEQRLRGGCPADWVWIVPPMSGSVTPVFHQEMVNYHLKPSYEYQMSAWKTHVWKNSQNNPQPPRNSKKWKLRDVAGIARTCVKMMRYILARRTKCTILYATETGKSERFARTLCRMFNRAFAAKTLCMDEYNVSDLKDENLILVVTSTFGDGDPPENGEVLSNALKNWGAGKAHNGTVEGEQHHGDLTDDSSLATEKGLYSHLRYSVFGLGSRAYESFCAFGHFMHDSLGSLGAKAIHAIGEGDELSGQEKSFRQWAKDTFKAACEEYHIEQAEVEGSSDGAQETSQSWTPSMFRLVPIPGAEELPLCQGLSKLRNRKVSRGKLLTRRNLTPGDPSRETILVEIESDLPYQPGDHLAIYPANRKEMVDAILDKLHDAPPSDEVLSIKASVGGIPGGVDATDDSPALRFDTNFSHGTPSETFPPCSLRRAFTDYLDINSPPTPLLLDILVKQASDKADQEQLQRLATDPEAYKAWKRELSPNIVDVLSLFPSLKVPATLLLTQLPLLQQRFYSISSSPQAFPGEIHATVAVVQWKAKGGDGATKYGVCSNWLNTVEIGSSIPCMVRRATNFHMPLDKTLPIMMVGPGTGIAPFRSFWQQRKIDKKQNLLNPDDAISERGWGELTLYFGCRQAEVDQLFKGEIYEARSDGVITQYYTALSREPDQPKTYVQDHLMKNAEDVFRLTDRGGHVFVCGGVAMARDVKATLEKIVEHCGKLSQQSAHKYIHEMKEEGRFHEDIFSSTFTA